MAYISSAARQFASPRETSDEIAQAILTLDSDRDAAAIWTDPTDAERAAVIAEAWNLADADESELNWGTERICREAP